VTSQTDQIQALINEIDAVLSKASPRLPWVMSGETVQQRQVLEQTRTGLVSLQQQLESGNAASLSQYAQEQMPAAESAQQVLQAVLQEMSYLRTNVMQPLRTAVDLLREQRESLQQEIRQLEAQRQQYALPQSNPQVMNDFLQALMARLQETIAGQVSQMVGSLEVQAQRERALTGEPALPAITAGNSSLMLSPMQRLEQLQSLQTQSDQLLLNLDSSMRVIFESLQHNLQSYQDSLSTGLEKMHTLGEQGEVMFTALVNRLAQQLGREASSYLQSTVPGGLEFDSRSLPAATLEEISDAQIDSFLDELGATSVGAIASASRTSSMAPSVIRDLINLDLDALSPSASAFGLPLDSDDEATIFQVNDFSFKSVVDDDITVFQTNDESTLIQAFTPRQTESYEKVDEFYARLFGTGGSGGEAVSVTSSPAATTSSATRATAR